MVDFGAHLKRCRAAHPREFVHGKLFGPTRHPAVTLEVLHGQHEIRAWEYSVALKALDRWIVHPPTPLPEGKVFGNPRYVADVGGAGSHLYKALWPRLVDGGEIHVIDPAIPTPDGEFGIVHDASLPRGVIQIRATLGQWAAYKANAAHYDAVLCLSVLEHVPPAEVPEFLSRLRALVRPGGLLVITCDMGEHNPDVYHFHWMRQWIPTGDWLAGCVETMRRSGFRPMGKPADYTYHGPTCYDYTVAAMVLEREG